MPLSQMHVWNDLYAVLLPLRQLVSAQKTNIEWFIVAWTRKHDQTGFYERLDIATLRVLGVLNENDEGTN